MSCSRKPPGASRSVASGCGATAHTGSNALRCISRTSVTLINALGEYTPPDSPSTAWHPPPYRCSATARPPGTPTCCPRSRSNCAPQVPDVIPDGTRLFRPRQPAEPLKFGQRRSRTGRRSCPWSDVLDHQTSQLDTDIRFPTVQVKSSRMKQNLIHRGGQQLAGSSSNRRCHQRWLSSTGSTLPGPVQCLGHRRKYRAAALRRPRPTAAIASLGTAPVESASTDRQARQRIVVQPSLVRPASMRSRRGLRRRLPLRPVHSC